MSEISLQPSFCFGSNDCNVFMLSLLIETSVYFFINYYLSIVNRLHIDCIYLFALTEANIICTPIPSSGDYNSKLLVSRSFLLQGNVIVTLPPVVEASAKVN